MLLRQSKPHREKRKQAFFFLYVVWTVVILFVCEKNHPKMTWIALDPAFWGELSKLKYPTDKVGLFAVFVVSVYENRRAVLLEHNVV